MLKKAKSKNLSLKSSSINYFRYGLYVLVGLVLGQKELVLYHRNFLYQHFHKQLPHTIKYPYDIKPVP